MNHSLVLAARPSGLPKKTDFAIVEQPIPQAGEGQIVVRNAFASLDPALRQRMTLEDSYVKRIELGESLSATTVGTVVESRHPRFAKGDHVVGHHTISDYSVSDVAPTTRHVSPQVAALSNHLSILGMTGLTAYFGILRVGRISQGETVLVSAAAGAVGSIVGQIARLRGCRVIGIAGSPEKARRLIDEFRYDGAIDYRGLDLAGLTAAIRQQAPDGVDVYFDNVGGIQLDAALDCLRNNGRVALCGLISQYNSANPSVTLHNLFKVIARSICIQGFIVRSYADEFEAAAAELAQWVERGDIRFREQIVEGLEQAPEAFLHLFSGANDGKLMVRLAG
jgi:NADPH-dependent curcumin reductase CurA